MKPKLPASLLLLSYSSSSLLSSKSFWTKLVSLAWTVAPPWWRQQASAVAPSGRAIQTHNTFGNAHQKQCTTVHIYVLCTVNLEIHKVVYQSDWTRIFGSKCPLHTHKQVAYIAKWFADCQSYHPDCIVCIAQKKTHDAQSGLQFANANTWIVLYVLHKCTRTMHKVVLPIRLDPDLPRNFSICFCFDGERWRLGTLGRSLLPGGVNVNVGTYFLNVGHEPRFTSFFLRMPDNKCNMII